MEDNQSYLGKQLEETELHLRAKLKDLTEARVDGDVLMAYATMIKLVQGVSSGINGKQKVEDMMHRLFDKFGDR